MTGDNGLLTKAKVAEIQSNHTSVYEAIELEAQSYYLEKQTGALQDDIITYFNKAKIIKENTDIIDVEKLVGHKLSTGNGTKETGDVYVLEKSLAKMAKLASTSDAKVAETEEVTKSYVVKYYGKDNKEEIPLGNISDKIVEVIEEEAYSYLLKNEDGVITLKPDWNSWYSYTEGIKLTEKDGSLVKDFIVPTHVGGARVREIGSGAFGYSLFESVTIQEGLIKVGGGAFSNSWDLLHLSIPGSVARLDGSAFSECYQLKTVNLGLPASELSIRLRSFL